VIDPATAKAVVAIRERRDSDANLLVPALHEVHLLDAYPIMEYHATAEWLFGGEVERAWVATVDDTAIAHISVVRDFSAPGLAAALPDGTTTALGLTRLFVTPEGRGLGAASRLIATVEEFAGAAPLALEVVEHNHSAIALYERRGWRRINSYESSWFGDDGPHPLSHVYLAPAGH
jgi:GNAT superfamily N-acetyltransferase